MRCRDKNITAPKRRRLLYMLSTVENGLRRKSLAISHRGGYRDGLHSRVHMSACAKLRQCVAEKRIVVPFCIGHGGDKLSSKSVAGLLDDVPLTKI